jgi:hypothetical protein
VYVGEWGKVGVCVEKRVWETGANPQKWGKVSPRPRSTPDFARPRKLVGQRLFTNLAQRRGWNFLTAIRKWAGAAKVGLGEPQKSGAGGTRPTLIHGIHQPTGDDSRR